LHLEVNYKKNSRAQRFSRRSDREVPKNVWSLDTRLPLAADERDGTAAKFPAMSDGPRKPANIYYRPPSMKVDLFFLIVIDRVMQLVVILVVVCADLC